MFFYLVSSITFLFKKVMKNIDTHYHPHIITSLLTLINSKITFICNVNKSIVATSQDDTLHEFIEPAHMYILYAKNYLI